MIRRVVETCSHETAFLRAYQKFESQSAKVRLKLVQAWIEIHQEELMADWKLAVSGERVFRIDPLQ